MRTRLKPELALEAVRAVARNNGNKSHAARELGLPMQTLRGRLEIARTLGLTSESELPKPIGEPCPDGDPDASESVSEAGDSRAISKTTSTHVRTLEDLIRVCEIDTTIWDVERWVVNKWEMGSVPRTIGRSKNWRRASADPVVTELYQVKAWLRRKTARMLTLTALRDGLIEDIRAEVKHVKPVRMRRKFVDGDWLFEFSPFDLHMGKYAWAEETVTNYDVDIAADLFNAALDFLLERALKLTSGRIARVLCVFGNDVAHIDSKRGDTTDGTSMDVNTRYVKIYRRICAIHRRAVDILRDVAPVDIKIVPGNHDELTAFHLGEILATRYEFTKHVSVDNIARLRKYYEFGTNLFGFAHGHIEKVDELPLLMAREMPDAWSRCASREWHIGHKHLSEKFTWRDQDLFSDKGVRVRRLTSLSSHDAWHTKHAYADRRACEAFVFHKEAGFTDHISFNVDHFTGQPLTIDKENAS